MRYVIKNLLATVLFFRRLHRKDVSGGCPPCSLSVPGCLPIRPKRRCLLLIPSPGPLFLFALCSLTTLPARCPSLREPRSPGVSNQAETSYHCGPFPLPHSRFRPFSFFSLPPHASQLTTPHDPIKHRRLDRSFCTPFRTKPKPWRVSPCLQFLVAVRGCTLRRAKSTGRSDPLKSTRYSITCQSHLSPLQATSAPPESRVPHIRFPQINPDIYPISIQRTRI